MKAFVLFIFIFSFFYSSAQNLVLNHSFEKRVQSLQLKQGAPPPLPCANFKSKRPSSVNSKKIHFNYAPPPKAASGEKYALLLVKTKKNSAYKTNAIKLNLCEALQKDSVYYFSIKVLGEINVVYNEIPFQVLLCNNCKEAEEKAWKNNPLMVQFLPNNNLAIAQGWTELKGLYKANGGEKFMLIYNFKPGKKTKIKGANNTNNYIVYIDDVQLYLKDKTALCVPQKQGKKYTPKF